MRVPQKRLASRRLALCLAVTTPSVSLAVEYSALPSISLQETYNDNIRMRTTPGEPVTGTILTPRLNLGARTATWQIGADTSLSAARYRGAEELDSNGGAVNLFSQIQSERNTLQLGGGRTRDSILTGEIRDADTGLAKTQTFRIIDSANTSWTWFVTEKDQFKLGYEYSDVVYKDNITALYDYNLRGPNTTLTHQLNERTQVFLKVSRSLFAIPEFSQSQLGQFAGTRILSLESTTNNLQIGIDYQFSETLRGSLSAGQRKTSSDNVVESCTIREFPTGICRKISSATLTTENRGSVYTVTLAKSFAASKLSARAERAIDPSGSGALVQRDTLNMNMNWSKTERLGYLFSVWGDKIRALENTPIFVDRNQYFIEPGLQWRVTTDSGLNLSYRYSYLRYVDAANSAHSNAIYLSFTQAWRKISISR